VRANAVARLEARLSELAGAPVELERPNDPEHGDYATNVAMQLAPVRKRSPRELGEELAAAALDLEEIERAEVAGPGFVNFWLTPGWFGEALGEMLEAGAGFGGGSAERPQKMQVEMVSANPTGPITVASARNGAIGDSVARLLEFAGH
jgi:arginyl-tRNA synthetase